MTAAEKIAADVSEAQKRLRDTTARSAGQHKRAYRAAVARLRAEILARGGRG